MADLASAKVKGPGRRAANSTDEKSKSSPRAAAEPPNEATGHESVKDELLSVGVTEPLDLDDRPVFILDVKSATRSNPVYYNQSLREIPILEQKIGRGIIVSRAAVKDPNHLVFSEWMSGIMIRDLLWLGDSLKYLD
jgi:hypothetical protein